MPRPTDAQPAIRWRAVAAALFGLAAAGAAVAVWPRIDLAVSAAFYRPGRGFLLAGAPGYDAVRLGFDLIHPALAYVVGGFVAGAVAACALAALRRSAVLGIEARGWAFLLMALLVGPGLLVNAVLKENWGRPRPADVTAFGGAHAFTPALEPGGACAHNCSFVAGDPSLGFYLQAFGYVRRRRQRSWLAAGLAAGGIIGLLRIGLGAHFLSDVVFCGLVVLAANAALCLALLAPGRGGARAARLGGVAAAGSRARASCPPGAGFAARRRRPMSWPAQP